MIRFRYNSEKTILVLFGDSTGEIDWLLPVLHTMKQQEGERLKLLFVTQTGSLFKKLSEKSYYGKQLRSLGKLLAHEKAKQFDLSSVDVMLKADDPDNEVTEYYRNKMPETPVVVFPSGTAILSRSYDTDDYLSAYFDFILSKTGRELRHSQKEHALWLTTSPELEPMARLFSTRNKIRHIGCPRYEEWWMDRVKQERQSEHTIRTEKRTVLFVIRGPHWLYQSEQDYDYLVREFMTEICERDDAVAVIKPHPRQDRCELEKLLSQYDSSKWTISDLSLIELTQSSDAVVCMFSSGVMDALAVNKPVAEFFRYHDLMPVMEYRKSSEGRMISIYEELGLVKNLRDRQELTQFLNSVLATKHIYRTDPRVIEAFKRVTLCDQSPSKRACYEILNVKRNKETVSVKRQETVLC